MNFRVASMSPSLVSCRRLSLPYRLSSTNNSFERFEKAPGGNSALRPLRSSRLHKIGKAASNVPCPQLHR